MSDNDKLLLKRAKKGDVEAFEQLIGQYQKKVFNIALRMIGNPEDASELAQEVFIRIYRSLANFKEEASFSTWIYRITTNVCLDEIRKRKNTHNTVSLDEEVSLEDGDVRMQVADHRPTPEAVVERNEVQRMVQEAIGQLSEEHRTALVLRDIQGMSYEEISRITQCPEGTVKSRINRARQSLKEILVKKRELFNEDYVK